MQRAEDLHASATAGPRSSGSALRLRRDLQGVRGLGIIFVVVGHLWSWPPGVFAMLDMFFVLSGFLITAILIRALGKYGVRFLPVFALSRARRLMPASITVIVVTVGLTYAVFNSARGANVADDGLWALLLAVNWHFASSGTDYFANDAGSPLLHYWSLSVEEQFYAVWPLFILLLLVVAARRRVRPLTLLTAGIAIVTAVAFTYSVWHSVASPTAAYFSTIDRAWEFGIGGLIGALAGPLARLPGWAGITLSWGGTLGLIATLYLLPYGVPFPAPYGLFPSLLTGAIIVGGLDRDTRYIPILDNRWMIHLGDMSYSIYLCHLPVNVLIGPLFVEDAAAYYLAAVAVTLVTSTACYYLVERPLREAPWLMTRPERERRASWSPTEVLRLKQGWLALLATVVVAVGLASLLRPTAEGANYPSEASFRAPLGRASDHDRLEAAQQDAIVAALRRADFPEFDPPLAELSFDQLTEDWSGIVCPGVDDTNFESCHVGPENAQRQAVLVGDSIASAWMPGIRKALLPEGWGIQQITRGWCPTWTLPSYVTPEGQAYPECEDQHEDVEEYVQRTQPDLVILAGGFGHVRNVERDDIPDDQETLARTALAETLSRLTPWARRIAVLGPPVAQAVLTECVSRISGPARCVTHPDPLWLADSAGERAAARAAGAIYVSTEEWFCTAGQCPGFIGDTPVTVDGIHLTRRMSERIAPLLAGALLPQSTRVGAAATRRAQP